MKEIIEDFKQSGKYFVKSVGCFFRALLLIVVLASAVCCCVINGNFGKYSFPKPYITYWRVLTWGTLIGYIFFQLLLWWRGIVEMLDYIIWGI